MTVYNYENQTYRYTGGSIINDPKDTKQEGVLIYLRKVTTNERLEVFMDKRDAAQLAKFIKTGRGFWKRFRLPKMMKEVVIENV